MRRRWRRRNTERAVVNVSLGLTEIIQRLERLERRQMRSGYPGRHIEVSSINQPVMIDLSLDMKLAMRDIRAAAIDLKAICGMAACVLEPMLTDEQLPADRLEVRRAKRKKDW